MTVSLIDSLTTLIELFLVLMSLWFWAMLCVEGRYYFSSNLLKSIKTTIFTFLVILGLELFPTLLTLKTN